MKTALAALVAVSALAAAMTTSCAAGLIDGATSAAVMGNPAVNARPSYLPAPDPGYIIYPDSAAALPSANCYWTRKPLYNLDHNVIGWRGRPVAVCPQAKPSAQAK
jgi:hypothetical protein